MTTKTTQAETILKRSVCLMLTCGRVGIHRKVDPRSLKMQKDGAELDKEKDTLAVSKKLVDASELTACGHVIAAAKNYLRSVSTSGHRVFGPGTYLVPILLVEEVEERLAQFQTDLAGHAADLAARWPDVIERSKAALGPLFNSAEIPTAEDVLSEYELDWSYVSFAAPERLEEVDRAVYERAQTKYQGKLAQAYDEVLLGLREAALSVMKELADRLRPGPDGKPKALRATALRDLQDLLGRLPVLNITDDDPLAAVVARVGALTEGLDVDTLKKAPAIRGMLLAEAEKAAGDLDALVLAGRRAMHFGAGSF